MNIAIKQQRKETIRPQEIVIDHDDIEIDGTDLMEFLSQGGTLLVTNSSRCVVRLAPPLSVLRKDEWERIRRSCKMKYRNISPLNVTGASYLSWESPKFKSNEDYYE